MGIGAKSLILDLLATLKPGAVMPVGVLVEAGALFGVSGNNMRVSAARLLANGHIARDERGCYRLGEKSKPIGRLVRSWRDLDRRTRKWSGGWIAAMTGKGDRSAARKRTSALALLGFRRFRDGVWVRPDNLTLEVDAVRAELHSLGLPAEDLVCRVRDLGEGNEAAARGLWNVDELRAAYRGLCSEVEHGGRRLASLAGEEAMVESFLLGGRALRQLVRDPLLPDEICPSSERDGLLAAMREYDRLGRLAWAEMLKRWGVPYLRTPLDGGGESERPRLAS